MRDKGVLTQDNTSERPGGACRTNASEARGLGRPPRDRIATNVALTRGILLLDMSYTLKMIRDRQLEQVLVSRKLNGYFEKVISVHPLGGLLEAENGQFGKPVVTQLDDGHVFIEGKIGVTPLGKWLAPLNFLWAQIQLLILLMRWAKQWKISVVRVGDPYYLGILGYVLSRTLGIPLGIRVAFNYDLQFRESGRAVFPRLFRFRLLEKITERFVFSRCDLVAGANQNNLDYALSNGANPKIKTVFRYGNLIHPHHFLEPSIRAHKRPQEQAEGMGDTFLLTISRLETVKKPEHALEVLGYLRKRRWEIDLVIVGDGSLRHSLQKMAQQMGLEKHVWFAGNRSQEWIAKVLPQARLILSPHMGRALVEACLAAKPIVAYDYDWQGEIIQSGKTGELVGNGDWQQMAKRAENLLKNPEIAEQLGAAARQLILANMSPDRMIRTETEAYEKLFQTL